MLVGDGSHDGAYGETVEVVVDEDDTAQQHGGQLGACTALDALRGPCAKGRRASGTVHELHHRAKDDEEGEDANVPLVGEHGHDAFGKELVEDFYWMELGNEQGTREYSEEEGTIDFLGNERKRDGHEGRSERPEGVFDGHAIDAYGIIQTSHKQQDCYQRQVCGASGVARTNGF